VEQVIDYVLGSGNSLSSVSIPTGSHEVEFNYFTAMAGGPAFFTFGGKTYTSTGAGVPAGTANDFIFNPNGSLLGGVSEDGSSLDVGVLPQGWIVTPLPPSLLLLASGLLSLAFAARLTGTRNSRKLSTSQRGGVHALRGWRCLSRRNTSRQR
jgi:hypothetical protein